MTSRRSFLAGVAKLVLAAPVALLVRPKATPEYACVMKKVPQEVTLHSEPFTIWVQSDRRIVYRSNAYVDAMEKHLDQRRMVETFFWGEK